MFGINSTYTTTHLDPMTHYRIEKVKSIIYKATGEKPSTDDIIEEAFDLAYSKEAR